MKFDREKAYSELIQYMLDERDYQELKQRVLELKEQDSEHSRRRRTRCKLAMWKTRYGFDVVKYVRDHLDEDVEDVAKNALDKLERYRLDDLY